PAIPHGVGDRGTPAGSPSRRSHDYDERDNVMARRGGGRPGPAQEVSAPMRDSSSPITLTAATRRRAVGPKWPGIYERTGANGKRRLEVEYYDETGRRRWQSLPAGTTLAEATAEREKLRVRRRDGERFAPAKSPTIDESWQ